MITDTDLPVKSRPLLPPAQYAAIARIQARLPDGRIERGTGFVVGREYILTSLHVVADRKAIPVKIYSEIKISFGKDQITQVKLVDCDAVSDWALLRCSIPDHIQPLALRIEGAGGRDHHSFRTAGYPNLNA